MKQFWALIFILFKENTFHKALVRNVEFIKEFIGKTEEGLNITHSKHFATKYPPAISPLMPVTVSSSLTIFFQPPKCLHFFPVLDKMSCSWLPSLQILAVSPDSKLTY